MNEEEGQQSQRGAAEARRGDPPLPERLDVYGVERSPMANMASAFDFALQQREFEINQLTQRNNFFMIFQGVLIAGIVQSAGSASPVIGFLVCMCGAAVSLLQTFMAGGAKFWQSRWEASARKIEGWLLEELADQKYVHQFFTADSNGATSEEKQLICRVNARSARKDDPLISFANYHDDLVRADVLGPPGLNRASISSLLARMFIMSRWSVSRIPIYVGLVFAVFWVALGWQTFNFPSCSASFCFQLRTLSQ